MWSFRFKLEGYFITMFNSTEVPKMTGESDEIESKKTLEALKIRI